jgi:hypothetical protein
MSSHRFAASAAVMSLALVALAAVPVGAQSPAAVMIPSSITDPTVLANIATVIAYEDAVDEVKPDQVRALLADGFVDEGDRFTLPNDPTNNEDEVVLAQKLEELYPGSTDAINSIGGWGDQVVVSTTLTIPAHTLTPDKSTKTLDTPLEVDGIAIFTVVDGQITHEVSLTDELGLFTGLGLIPPLGN